MKEFIQRNSKAFGINQSQKFQFQPSYLNFSYSFIEIANYSRSQRIYFYWNFEIERTYLKFNDLKKKKIEIKFYNEKKLIPCNFFSYKLSEKRCCL